MTVYITGFICALVLAALVVIWIACCMFVRERHKSELYQQDLDDLRRRNCIFSMEDKHENKTKDMAVGVFVLPSRRKQTDEVYDKRPDYPESPVAISHPSTDRLIEILDSAHADVHYKDGIHEVDSAPCPYSSDV